MTHYILAIDQGTTNSRAIIFDQTSSMISQHEISLTQYFPQDGWVEQDAEEMFKHTVECCRMAMQKANISAQQVAAIGISNQRETTIIWDKNTGKPIYPAIVWQDRRTHLICREFSEYAFAKTLPYKTGLRLDPYFSATKIYWVLENVPGARKRAEKGELLFGTVDTYLLWRLTNGESHLTDATNASRTLLFNLHTQTWDQEILDAFQIPASLLPTVVDNAADFGKTTAELFGKPIAITGMAGDQQAATIGQTCFKPGMIKATYGTGCFMLVNTGNQFIESKQNLLSTIAYRINGNVTYGVEGSIFSAGVIVKWLRDTLKIIQTAAETENIARQLESTESVYLVPAFTGLGAPYWDPEARAAIIGLTRNSGRDHIVRAGLESVAYQTRDLLDSMLSEGLPPLQTLRVDGGMSANNWLMQFVSDILNVSVERPACIETSALGVAYLAGLKIGLYASLDEIGKLWQCDANFDPAMSLEKREQLYAGWQRAVQRVR